MADEPTLLIAHVSSESTIFVADVLKIGSELWLVPMWSELPDQGLRRPKRAIRIDQLPHQMVGVAGADITVNRTIPKDVLNGPATRGGGFDYEVVEEAAGRFPWIEWRKASS